MGEGKTQQEKNKMEQNNLSSIPLFPEGRIRVLWSMFIFHRRVVKATRHRGGKEEDKKKMKIRGKEKKWIK